MTKSMIGITLDCLNAKELAEPRNVVQVFITK